MPRLSRTCQQGSLYVWGLLALLILLCRPSVGHAEFNIGTMINWADPKCTEYKVIGLCFCGGVPCGYRVHHYLPVVLSETVNTPGDSLVTSVLGEALSEAKDLHTRQIGKHQKDNTFETHVWEIPEWARTVSSAGASCLGCTGTYAKMGAMTNNSSSGNSGVNLCGSDVAVKAAMNAISGAIPSQLPKLLYASEVDAFNWRTGCRDVNLSNTIRSNGLTCSAAGLAGIGGDIVSQQVTSLLGEDACVGTWGPLYPRQMRTLGPSQITASALNAYRAMSNSAKVFQTMPYMFGMLGRMQLGYPQMSTCFRPGASPLTWQTKQKASKDGKYAWVWWVPVTCCVSFDSISQCLANSVSGT